MFSIWNEPEKKKDGTLKRFSEIQAQYLLIRQKQRMDHHHHHHSLVKIMEPATWIMFPDSSIIWGQILRLHFSRFDLLLPSISSLAFILRAINLHRKLCLIVPMLTYVACAQTISNEYFLIYHLSMLFPNALEGISIFFFFLILSS